MATYQARRQQGRLSPGWPASVAALLLAACTSWAPAPFSAALTSDEPCGPAGGRQPGNGTKDASGIQQVIDEIKEVRRRYIRAAQCLTGESSAAGIGLIGLSSLALFKGITSPHSRDMAGLGVLGGATYLASGGADTSAIARRRTLYYAGAAALNCSLRFAETFQSGGSEERLLVDLINTAQATQSELLRVELGLREHNLSAEVDTQPGRRAAAGCDAAPQSCTEPGASATAREQAGFETCKAILARCTSSADTTRPKRTHPAVKAMINNLVKTHDEIEKLVFESTEVQAKVRKEPSRIGSQVAGIQTRVGDEASKTFPDVTAVLNSLGGLKAASFKVSGATALSDAAAEVAGSTESAGPAARPKTKDLPVKLMTDAQSALTAASLAAARLRRALQLEQGRFSDANSDLQACAMVLPGAPAAGTAPPPAAPAPAAPATAASAPQPTVVTANFDPKLMAPLLGLPSTATVEQLQSAIKTCQQQVLKRGSATGISVDSETMMAILGEACKAASP